MTQVRDLTPSAETAPRAAEVRSRRPRRLARWLLRPLDVRRIGPWWRQQSAAVRAVVVAGVVIGALLPALMIQHGWRKGEESRRPGGERGIFTVAFCSYDVVPDSGRFVMCSGSFDSPSTHLASTDVPATRDLADGTPLVAYFSRGQVRLPDDGTPALEFALWATLALFVVALETVVMSSLVTKVRGGRRGLELWVKMIILFAAGIPAAILTMLLLLGCCMLFGLP